MRPASVVATGQNLSDADIARRIAAGDEREFSTLMRQYNQTLYRTARSILKDDAEAEDAVQEAYLLAFRAMSKYRAEAKMSTWLVRIVVNEAFARLRKRRRHADVIPLDGPDEPLADPAESNMNEISSAEPEHAAVRSETRRLLEAKIDALPDVYRTAFVLRAIEELSVEEAAISLGIPQATVRTRYFRARSLLREALAREIDIASQEAFAFAGERCDRIVNGVLTRLRELRSRRS